MSELRRLRRRELVRIAWRDLAGWAERRRDACRPLRRRRCRDSRGATFRHAPARCALRRAALADGSAAGTHHPCDGQARWPRAQLLVGRRSRVSLSRARRHGWPPLDRERGILHPAGPADHPAARSQTADGFVYRVDLRLRPFGDSGPLVASLGAFENYLEQHGRDWERYAYVKARAVTGLGLFEAATRDLAAAVRLSALSRLSRIRGAARDEGADRARSRTARARAQHQARPGRHPRNRIHRAGVPASARRQRSPAAVIEPARRSAAPCGREAVVAGNRR